MSKSDDLLLLVGGAIGLAALFNLLKNRQTQQPLTHQCPECRNQIQNGTMYCPYCYTSLRWV
jgi:hypothetical protein